MQLFRAIVFASLCAAAPAYAQPAPQGGSKVDAKALVQSGVRLLEAKDYLGALAIFRDAYVRFPSAKILLNIGTTLKLLDRKAEAANTYQRYLDSPDADANRKSQVTAELAELDKAVGRVEITVTPPDAEILLGDEWLPAAKAKVLRLSVGTFKLQARREGYQPDTKSASIAAGEKAAVVFNLIELPKEKPQVLETPRDDLGAHAVVEGPRSRIGALAVLHVSVIPKLGSAALVGATGDLTEQLAIDAAVLLGPGLISDGMGTALPPPSFGGYVGASFAFLPAPLRPRAGAGMTIFMSDGARFQVRGAGGVEYVASRHISMVLELGAEYVLNPENDIREIAVVPAFAFTGRL